MQNKSNALNASKVFSTDTNMKDDSELPPKYLPHFRTLSFSDQRPVMHHIGLRTLFHGCFIEGMSLSHRKVQCQQYYLQISDLEHNLVVKPVQTFGTFAEDRIQDCPIVKLFGLIWTLEDASSEKAEVSAQWL